MAGTRLTNGKRDRLVRFAMDTADIAPELRRARDESVARAEALVHAGMLEQFPLKDMKVLDRYGVARRDRCLLIKTQEDSSDLDRFEFSSRDELDWPLVPARYCSSRALWLGVEAGAAVTEAIDASKAWNAARFAAERDFRALAHSATTVEAVIKAWAPWEALREELCAPSTSMSTLSPELRQRVAQYGVREEAA